MTLPLGAHVVIGTPGVGCGTLAGIAGITKGDRVLVHTLLGPTWVPTSHPRIVPRGSVDLGGRPVSYQQELPL